MEETAGQANLDNLVDDSIKQKKKMRLFIGLGIVIVIVVIVIVVIVVLSKKDEKDKDSDYKFTSIKTVELPKGIIYKGHAIYSKTGHIIFSYGKENDNNTYIGVMDEDGTNLKELWKGEWKALYRSNGIRLMPFDDNKRILTGDYVLECTPSIDDCQESELIDVIYPEESIKMEGVYFVWSEIIVSPDEHIAWSTLSSAYNDVNFLGKLERNEDNYTISDVQIISTLGFIHYEDKEKGILKHETIRGGEVKQFTNGGEAITLAGNGNSALAKSVFQNLVGEENYPLTNFPGYEETTIISPDGKLGLTMTTRFSPKTSSEIISFMPRPLTVYTPSQMNRYAYFYGVQEVRKERKGNIGPALINIEESKSNSSYMGYDLHEEGWAFNSPMSWHPSSKKALFSENSKPDTTNRRIRLVYLDNYKPSQTLENKKTPDNISYAKTLEDLAEEPITTVNGYFKGRNGTMIYNRTLGSSKSEYLNYSDDGKIFYNGIEEFRHIDEKTGRLISNIEMTGEKSGKMNLSLTMNYDGNIIYENGKEKVTYGYVEYDGKKMTVEDSYEK